MIQIEGAEKGWVFFKYERLPTFVIGVAYLVIKIESVVRYIGVVCQ